MLPSVDSLKSDLMNIKPSKDKLSACRAFAKVIGDFMSQAQAGPLGQPGILKFNTEVMAMALMTQGPVTDQSWASTMAQAWLAGLAASIIVPAQTSNPAWVGSGGKDVATLPLGLLSIPTAAIAQTLLQSLLMIATQSANPPVPMATAFKAAAGACVFLTIGLGPLEVPIPIPTPAQ
jgi:hypothetical protein